jgi:hypothetical protein
MPYLSHFFLSLRDWNSSFLFVFQHVYLHGTVAANFLIRSFAHLFVRSYIGVSNLFISLNIAALHQILLAVSFSLGFTTSRTDRSFHGANDRLLQLFFFRTVVISQRSAINVCCLLSKLRVYLLCI